MLRRRIVARIDVKGSNVVKGIHLEGLRIIGNPTEYAIRYQQQGADEILYLDLVASLYGRNNLVDIVRATAKDVFIPLTVGGGVRTIEDISALLDAGADKVAMNTAAIRRPAFITEAANVFGRQCVVVSIEAMRKGSGWEAYTENAREPQGVDVIDWVKDAIRAGAGEILVTSIDRDGARKGMDRELLKAVSQACTVPYIFSGGVGSIEDVCRAFEEAELPALALASVLHYNTLTIGQVKHALAERGIPVREDPFSPQPMTASPRILVVIPARGGSKRFPDKNLALLDGKPLLSYPIDAAKQVARIDRIVVSTDDERIAALARELGAEVPFMRPAEHATDASPVIDTVVHLVKELDSREGYRPDYVILLQTVTPLILPEHLEKAIDLAIEKQADSVIAVCELDTTSHPYSIREIHPDGTISFWQEKLHYELLGKPKPKFYQATNLWLSSRETLLNEHRLEGKKNFPIVIDRKYALDIDYPADLQFIEALIRSEAEQV